MKFNRIASEGVDRIQVAQNTSIGRKAIIGVGYHN